MLASYETATFTVLYRGYNIEVSRVWLASLRALTMAALKLSISSTFRSGLMYVANSRSVILVSGGFSSGIDLSSETQEHRLRSARVVSTVEEALQGAVYAIGASRRRGPTHQAPPRSSFAPTESPQTSNYTLWRKAQRHATQRLRSGFQVQKPVDTQHA